MTKPNTAADFWLKVNRLGPLPAARPDLGPCWLWNGSLTDDGYAYFRWAGPKVRVHRLSYELLVGPVPDGLDLDHLCRVRHCVRPTHLEPVTRRENILRGEAPAAANARKLACPQGHPYDEVNTYRDRSGRRYCTACRFGRKAA